MNPTNTSDTPLRNTPDASRVSPRAKLESESTGASPNRPDARAGQVHLQGGEPTEPGRGEIPELDAEEGARREGQMSEEARNQLGTSAKSRAESDRP